MFAEGGHEFSLSWIYFLTCGYCVPMGRGGVGIKDGKAVVVRKAIVVVGSHHYGGQQTFNQKEEGVHHV